MSVVANPQPEGIAIVGAGAIGSRIAAHLAQHGVASHLFDGWRAHVDAIRAHGLRLEQDGQASVHWLAAQHFDDPLPAQRFGTVLVAVRGDATASVMPLLSRLVHADGCAVSCQNGIGEDTIAEAIGAGRTLGCSMIFGALLSAPGVVQALRGEDTLCLGEMAGPAGPRALALRDLFAFCGTATTTDTLQAYRWKKLVYNCMGNPITLLTGLTAQELHRMAAARRGMIAIAREVMATARAAGVEPEPVLGHEAQTWLAADAFESMALHAALQGHGDFLGERRFSMWADFQQRGRTEVDALNGYVVHKGAALSVPTPANAAVVKMVHALEAGQPMATPAVIAELLQCLPRH